MGLKTKLFRAIGRGKRQCPKCWKVLPAEGSFCRACGSSLQKAIAISGFEATALSAEGAFKDIPEAEAELVDGPSVRCPHCTEMVPSNARYCSSCGKPLAARPAGSGTALIGGFDIATSSRARMAVLNADGTLRKAWPLTDEIALIGTNEGDILLERDPFISARHARLQKQEQRWSIEDLGTVNGVYRRIKTGCQLEHG